MSRSASLVLHRELANLEKDTVSRQSAMKALRSCVKELDSKSIPQFLSQVNDTKKFCSPTGEYVISLYEVVARVHGRKIVPQIDSIMSSIIRTLTSSAGSFPLHQACSKVIPTIAEYGIDPYSQDEEKAWVICSLCKPLSNVLMSSQESLASGAALCIKSLVESYNWRFAPSAMVNEVCLKAARAVEDKTLRSNHHMGLIMALTKHNGLVVEAYASSLIRSGLQIFCSISESNSQKRLSAIQMINFLMKCIDSRSITSELDSVIAVMEKCQGDDVPFIQGAAFEALQTAKFIAIEKDIKQGMASSPVKASVHEKRNSPAGFASPESRTLDSFPEFDAYDSSPSVHMKSRRPSNRKKWNDGTTVVDVSLKDGFFLGACDELDSSKSDYGTIDVHKEQIEPFSGFVLHSNTNSVKQETHSSPHMPQPEVTFDDIKMFSTPRQLMRALQDRIDTLPIGAKKLNNGTVASPSSIKAARSRPRMASEETGCLYSMPGEVWAECQLAPENKEIVHVADIVLDGTESVCSTDGVRKYSTHLSNESGRAHDTNRGLVKLPIYNKATLSFVCVIFLFFSILLLPNMLDHNVVQPFQLVPT